MNYPLLSEYIEAIKAAEDNFEELSYLRPVLGDDGLPVMTSGNFAVVFKMKDEQSGKFYAVKCFTKEQEGRAEAYKEITKELKGVSSPYIVSIRYLDKELFVDTDQTSETEFPVLLMDWVEGKSLDKYLRENLDDKYALEMLASRFSQMAQWLIPQPIAHGDLKPDNIIVREDGSLVLVDYDGMYVPSMKGQKAREIGSPNFRHPLRTETEFDDHIDDFSLVSILLSLKAILMNPQFLKEYGAADRLLFSEMDYRDIKNSEIINRISLMTNDNKHLLDVFLSMIRLEDVNLYIIFEDEQNEVVAIDDNDRVTFTKAEWDNGFTDNYGVRYSYDLTKLYSISSFIFGSYKIKSNVDTICDKAFISNSHFLREIHIPSSVRTIGKNPFAGCIGLCLKCDSPYFVVKDNLLYSNNYSRLISCTSAYEPHIYNKTRLIGSYSFYLYNHADIMIPSLVEIIESYSFMAAKIEKIFLPPSIRSIGYRAFYKCKNLTEISINSNKLEIDRTAFEECRSLHYIFVPKKNLEYYKSILPDYVDKIFWKEECEGSFSGAIIGDVYGKTYMYPSFVLYENYKERIELSDDLPF